MERTPTTHRPPQISLILRTLCGAYLLYLAWDLRRAAVQALRGEENLLFFYSYSLSTHSIFIFNSFNSSL